MEDKKYITLKLTKEEIDIIRFSLLDKVIYYRQNKALTEDKILNCEYSKAENKCANLLNHMNVALRYQGGNND